MGWESGMGRRREEGEGDGEVGEVCGWLIVVR